MIWDGDEESGESLAKDNICLARAYLQNKLSELPGMHLVLTCLTGVTSNAKRKGASRYTATKVGISAIVFYSPNINCNDDKIFDVCAQAGMNPTVNPIQSKKISEEEKNVAKITAALKDNNSSFGKDLLAHSLGKLKDSHPTVSFCPTPANFMICSHQLVQPLRLAYENLCRDGLTMSLFEQSGLTPAANITSEPPTGLSRALDTIKELMELEDLALAEGHIYCKAPGSCITYEQMYSVEAFIHLCLGNKRIHNCLINHTSGLVRLMSSKSFAYIRQLEIDFDLIEVSGGMCWHIPTLQFVQTDLGVNGRRSPRAFVAYDSKTVPNAHHFENTVTNSFPDHNQKILFLCKWYQLLVHQEMPLKTKKLLVYGPKNCGKTTIINPIMAFTKPEHVGSLTAEKEFSCSMLDPLTQLIFVDEFSDHTISAEIAKRVLQSGFFVTAEKHKKGRHFQNKANFYLTAQERPDWGKENVNVYERLEPFEMKPLSSINRDIASWLTDNAIDCVVWAGAEIKRHLFLIPHHELYFMRPEADVKGELRDHVSKRVRLSTVFRPQPRVKEPLNDPIIESEEDGCGEPDIDEDALNVHRQVNIDCLDNFVHFHASQGNSALTQVTVSDSDEDTSYFSEVRDVISHLYRMQPTEVKCQFRDHLLKRERVLQECRLRYIHATNTTDEKKVLLYNYLKDNSVIMYKKSDAHFDAWFTICGKRRDVFDLETFLSTYPCLLHKIRAVRERGDIRLETVFVDHTEDVAVVVSQFLTDLLSLIW